MAQPQQTYSTAFHTPFSMYNPNIQEEMSRLYSQIFAVLITSEMDYITTIIWMNENFEKIYMDSKTGEDVYKQIFEHFEIKYK